MLDQDDTRNLERREGLKTSLFASWKMDYGKRPKRGVILKKKGKSII